MGPKMKCSGLSTGVRRNEEDVGGTLTLITHGQGSCPHEWEDTEFGPENSKIISEKLSI